MSTAINFQRTGLRNGLVAGGIWVLFTLTLYFIDKNLVLSPWVWIGYGVAVLIKIYTAITLKKQNNGILNFRNGLKAIFPISVVALLMWITFNDGILINIIDTDLIALSKEKTIEQSIWVMEKSGANEDEIASAVEEAKNQDYRPNLRNSAINYARSCIIAFIYSLVIAGFFHLTSANKSGNTEEA